MSPFRRIAVLALTLAAVPAIATAHPGHAEIDSFAGGVLHPLSGLDHILAMVAVGLIAAQLGGRALWLVPASFLAMMAVGGVLAVNGVTLPMVEVGVLASVVVFAVVVVARWTMPTLAAMALVGGFALFHGFAHGAEMPKDAATLRYALGFLSATAGLHALGIGLGLLAPRRIGARLARRTADTGA